MKAFRFFVAGLLACALPTSLAHAADPDGSSALRVAPAPTAQKPGEAPLMREFEPPPVPDFMLRKPAQPLTAEEMRRQVDEASERARRARAAAKPPAAAAEPAPAAPGYR